jgi:hypothetical protein
LEGKYHLPVVGPYGPEGQKNGAGSPRQILGAACLFVRFVERNGLARLVLRRLDDHLLARLAELLDVLV